MHGLMKRLILPLLLSPILALAQTDSTPGETPAGTVSSVPNQLPLWRCRLPGGAYEVALRSIVAVSSHEYIVDAAARVTEVNIDTQGSVLARFYFLEPHFPNSPLAGGAEAIKKARELATEAAERSGQDAWKKVIKTHPTTTHARTVEYRLVTKEQLQSLFDSVSTAFRTGKGADFSVH
ncbi:MAG: hypothetical protein EOP84_05375 [Verrucomicrobiaceae bacterium]|nr:MAG: hypothetical protein EOP84_05375 [Verrucomicrobiaceae bacterium]